MASEQIDGFKLAEVPTPGGDGLGLEGSGLLLQCAGLGTSEVSASSGSAAELQVQIRIHAAKVQ